MKLDAIDHYCKENNVKFIDFLKLDIEGNEYKALCGAKNMINQDKIGAIKIEFGGCNIDLRTFFRDFWFQLHEKNYVYQIMKSDWRFFRALITYLCIKNIRRYSIM